MVKMYAILLVSICCSIAACGQVSSTSDGGQNLDARSSDATQSDATQSDATQSDATQSDATQSDASAADATPPDANTPDAIPPDPCDPNPCNSGTCTANGTGFQCDCTGTGFDGVQCADNIDECTVGTDNCSQYSTCIDTIGSVTCACDALFSGDGVGSEGCCRDDNPLSVAINTVRDPATGLTWERDMEPGDYNHAQALDRCSTLGFRLPSRTELESLVDQRFTPTWMPCAFREDVTTSAWTATRVGSNSAFIVHFGFGGTGNDIITNRYGVLCVH